MSLESMVADKSYLYRKRALRSNLTLFIWNAAPLASSVMTRLLKKVAAEKKDETIAFVAQDYDALEGELGAWLETANLKLLMPHTSEFIKVLASATTIYTGGFLPIYYVKRPGQVVYGVFSAEFFAPKRLNQNLLKMAMHTYNNLDYLYTYDRADLIPVTVDDVKRDQVLVCLENAVSYGREIGRFRDLVSRVSNLIKAYGWQQKYLVPATFWRRCREYPDDLPLGDILPYSNDVQKLLDGTRLLLTDDEELAEYAGRREIPMLFLAQKPYTVPLKPGRIAYSIPGLYELADAFLSRDVWQAAREAENPEPVATFRLALPDAWQKVSHTNGKRILVVGDWNEIKPYFHRFGNWNHNGVYGGATFSLLTWNSGEGDFYDTVSPVVDPVHIACRTGRYQSSGQERALVGRGYEELIDPEVSREMVADEWNRLTGAVYYDEIWAQKSDDVFWKIMYREAPAENVEILERGSFLKRIAPMFADPAAKTRSTAPRTVQLGDKDYYALGSCGGTDYYLLQEAVGTSYAVCFPQTAEGAETREALSELDGTYETLLKIPPETLPGVPVELIAGAEAVVAANGSLEAVLAAGLGVRTITFPGGKEAAENEAALLLHETGSPATVLMHQDLRDAFIIDEQKGPLV